MHIGILFTWYYSRSESIGFSPTDTIDQTCADVADVSNNERVLWHTLVAYYDRDIVKDL